MVTLRSLWCLLLFLCLHRGSTVSLRRYCGHCGVMCHWVPPWSLRGHFCGLVVSVVPFGATAVTLVPLWWFCGHSEVTVVTLRSLWWSLWYCGATVATAVCFVTAATVVTRGHCYGLVVSMVPLWSLWCYSDVSVVTMR